MNNAFDKFAKEIAFTITPAFRDVRIKKAVLNDEEKLFDLAFEIPLIIPFEEMRNFLVAVNTNFPFRTKLTFDAITASYDYSEVKSYLRWTINDFLKQAQLAAALDDATMRVIGDQTTIVASSPMHRNKLEAVQPEIERIMQKFGFANFTLSIEQTILGTDQIAREKADLENRAQTLLDDHDTEKNDSERKVNFTKGYTEVAIDALADSHLQRVAIEGDVFSVNHRKTKTDFVITELALTNYKEAVIVKLFSRNDGDFKENSKYTEGMYLYVQGDYQMDTYSKEPVIIARKITIGRNPQSSRIDAAPKKRIELSARTRMSTMDGVVSPTDLVHRAQQWGHEAIAITDLDSVQAFPEFHEALKDSKVKGIFGATFRTISRDSGAVIGQINHKQSLSTDSYVVFDLETTGLSATFDDIVEFGAVKIVNGAVVSSKQFFVKPSRPIPAEITRITGINDTMVANAKPESEAIHDIRDFLGTSTLVAHNANFDLGFINEKFQKYSLSQLTNVTIDTLITDRIVHSDAKKFRLENVAVRYHIDYDSTVAHRADYDADVLAKIWLLMLVDLRQLGINTQEQLRSYISPALYNKAFAHEVVVLARNQDGLKELFQLVSQASTETFFGDPKLFIEDLMNRPNLLLGSGTLRSRLMDRVFYGTRQQVIEEIKRYDYIEVQPPKNFVHLQARGFTKQNIQDAITFVIHEAKRQGKIVVATGDVRYLDEKDKIYHEIYVNAKGLGGVRHHFFSYDRKGEIPTLQYLSTDEMIQQFSFLENPNLIYEIVVENTHRIGEKIGKIEVIKKGLFTPKMDNADALVTEFVYRSARAIYGDDLPPLIAQRIERELTPIKKYGFSVIYWISHLLVSKSLADGYLVGSRGSVGSSIVATLLNITEVNPLPPHYVCVGCRQTEFPDVYLNSGYDLPSKLCSQCQQPLDRHGQNIPFETFLGFNADKVPDIDLNFSGEYQAKIHDEVKNLFGDTHSFRAGTISTVADKTAFGYVLSWAEDTGRTISRTFTEFIAKGVAGTKRTTGQHPGGIIVVPKEMAVEDFTPINYPANDTNSAWKTTHFDFHAIHDNVLKLDLLGHDDPTAIRLLERLTGVNAKRDIPFSDERVLSLFSSTNALGIKPEDIDGEMTGAMGIPEFGTPFVRKMLRKAKVKTFGDLIAISGLSHGTDVWTNNAETLVVQHNRKLDEVISCRDNIMTDLMAKKIEPLVAFKVMESVRKGKGVTPEQESLLKQNGVDDWYIDSLKRIKYMFPKAHATAYVMMAWRVAWFKLYHPLAYYATYFTTRADVFDLPTIIKGPKVTLAKLRELDARRNKRGEEALTTKEEDLIPILELANEAFARGVKIANIDLLRSDANEWVLDQPSNTLYPPFIALDGLGHTVAESIVVARQELPFSSIEDMQNRTSVNKTLLEKMRLLGIFGDLSERNQISLDLFGL